MRQVTATLNPTYQPSNSLQCFANMLPVGKHYDTRTYDVKSTVSVKLVIQTNNKLMIQFPTSVLPYRVDYHDRGIPSNLSFDHSKEICIEMKDLRVNLLPDNLPRSK